MKEKQITIAGIKFILKKLPTLTALRLDKKVVQIILPALGGLSNLKGVIKNINLDTDLSNINPADLDLSKLGNIFQLFSECLMSMSDNEYEKFLQEMVQSTQAIAPGVGAIDLGDAGSLEQLDISPVSMYKLLYEIMQFNKFSPFELVVGGNGIIGTGFLNGQTLNETGTFQDSGMSEN